MKILRTNEQSFTKNNFPLYFPEVKHDDKKKGDSKMWTASFLIHKLEELTVKGLNPDIRNVRYQKCHIYSLMTTVRGYIRIQ